MKKKIKDKKVDKRLERGQKTKQAIINAALKIMITEGKEALTASYLAEKVGIGKASLFHHFGNMDEIFITTFEVMFDETIKRLKLQNYSSPKSLLKNLGNEGIEEAESFVTVAKGFLSLYEKFLFDPKLKPRLVNMLETFLNELKNNLKALSKCKFSEKELDGIAISLTLMLDTLGFYLILLGDRSRIENMWNQVINIYSAYIENGKTK